MRALLAILALTLATTILAQEVGDTKRSSSDKEFLPVSEAFQLDVGLLEAGELQLRWDIAETYYLYQHRFKFHLEDASGIVELAVELPEGLAKTDEFFGDVVVHYREADILLTPSRAVGQASLKVTSQGLSLIHI